MPLARYEGPPEQDRRLVAVIPAPGGAIARELDHFFTQMYRRLYPRLLDHAERFLNRQDAEDAVGDAVEVLWRRWDELTPDQRSDKWIFGVVHRCVAAVRRANKGLVSFEEAEAELDALAVSAMPEFSRGETPGDVLDLALAAMPPRRREVVLLVREQGLSYEEAGEALGLNINTIKTHLRLANADLAAAFKRSGMRLTDVKPARLAAPKGDQTND